jgi:hypothetical protein
VVILVVALVVVGYLVGDRSSTQRQSPTGTGPVAGADRSEVVRWMANTSPAAWDAASNRIFFNRRDGEGRWSGHSVLPDGTDTRCVTCEMPSDSSAEPGIQRGVSDVTPDGQFYVATVEKDTHPGPIGSSFSAPGRGSYNDLWLARVDGSKAWPLTSLPTGSISGVIWPRFDRTGTQLVWAQMEQGFDLTHPLGIWSMRVARIAWDGDTAVLRDERTFDPQPGRFYEPYQFSPDNQRIIFASDLDTPGVFLGPSQTNAQIWTIDAATFGDVRRVSPEDPLTGMFANYNEFAMYLPDSDGSRVMFSRTFESTAHGMDIWTAGADGGDVRRVTFLNEPDDAQHVGYAVAGGAAFDPNNPKRFVVGVSQNTNGEEINAYFVTLP